jgi:hypothetical protein
MAWPLRPRARFARIRRAYLSEDRAVIGGVSFQQCGDQLELIELRGGVRTKDLLSIRTHRPMPTLNCGDDSEPTQVFDQ